MRKICRLLACGVLLSMLAMGTMPVAAADPETVAAGAAEAVVTVGSVIWCGGPF